MKLSILRVVTYNIKFEINKVIRHQIKYNILPKNLLTLNFKRHPLSWFLPEAALFHQFDRKTFGSPPVVADHSRLCRRHRHHHPCSPSSLPFPLLLLPSSPVVSSPHLPLPMVVQCRRRYPLLPPRRGGTRGR